MKKKFIRYNPDDLVGMTGLPPKKVQALIMDYEREISELKIKIKMFEYALMQIREIRRGLTLKSFEETLPIGILTNNVLNMRE